jgi:HAE1 family hydrophobic/amphiphilic exporter-1
MQAAGEAVGEIGLAVLATTLSIVAVFVPVATMKGIIGRLFVQFGLTVAVAVLVSLFVAFTLTPMLSSRLLRYEAHVKRNVVSRTIGRGLKALDWAYRRLLGAALRHRFLTVTVAVIVFIASLAMARLLPTEFMSEEDRGQIQITAELPSGASLAATRDYAEGIVKEVAAIPGVDYTFTTIGGGVQAEVNLANIQVNLVDRKDRAFTQTEAISYIRSMLDKRKDSTIAVEPLFSMGGGRSGMRSAQIQYNLSGQDFAEINRAADEIQKAMKKKGGYVDLDTTYRGGKPEVTVRIDRDRAADLAVPVTLIALSIRTFFAGEKATDLEVGGDRYDVKVQLDEKSRSRLEDILRLKVRSMTGQLVSLSNVVSIGTGEGPAKIERYDRQHTVTLLANLEGKALGTAVEEIDEAAALALPASVSGSWTGMAMIMQESFTQLFGALALAILIVYLILAAQFESFLHPFTIMLSLPLSLIGAVGGLLMAGKSLNVLSMIGVIMLMGLVTKNAILLVDYTNTLRKRGMQREEALLAAGPVRLRPILMTTAAMIFGMLPVALALSAGGEIRSPMAVAVIGGLLTSMLLTLVVVPVAYSLLDSAKDRVAALFKGKKEAAVGREPAAHGGPPART